jgi:hypothetical protein
VTRIKGFELVAVMLLFIQMISFASALPGVIQTPRITAPSYDEIMQQNKNITETQDAEDELLRQKNNYEIAQSKGLFPNTLTFEEYENNILLNEQEALARNQAAGTDEVFLILLLVGIPLIALAIYLVIKRNLEGGEGI